MADEQRSPEETNPSLRNTLKESGVEVKKPRKKKHRPFYKMMPQSKIPVSKSQGTLWKSRRDQALAARRQNEIERSWDEALKYYYNDQLRHRVDTSDPDRPSNESVATQRNKRFSETENLVYANVRALVPVLYAKNPTIEATSLKRGKAEDVQQSREFATCVERLVNALIVGKVAPGVNLKPKARRCVVNTSLTNKSWIEIGYTFKEQSTDKALADVTRIAQELAEAKNTRQIEALEGQLMAAELKLDVLNPSGPYAKFRRPHQVLVDPDAVETDGSDANWIMCYDLLPTEFLKAMFTELNPNGEVVSIYKPTHVISPSKDGVSDVEETVNNFNLLTDPEDHKKHGYETQESFDRAKRTKVWYVWDKVTRRVLLYNDEDWSWPIWVWDDPFKLDRFFPYYPLEFYTDPSGGDSKGEVTYVLDQQDAINEINDEERRARTAIKRSIIFNKRMIDPEDFDKAIRYGDEFGIGVDLPEGEKLSDHTEAFPPPSVDFPGVFNTERKIRSMDRIMSSNEVTRGGQFKTNTTNQAIEAYEATSNTVLDEKIDAIEDFIGDIGWGIAQLCLQFMPKEVVAQEIGVEGAQAWPSQAMTPDQIRSAISIRTVGGSTAKPTSRAKKREAVEVGQVLGQFASVAPRSLTVAMKLFEQAFDEITITEEDWKALNESIDLALQQGQSRPQGAPSPAGAQANGSGPNVEQIIQSLPPELQQVVQTVMAQGVPAEQALLQIAQQFGGGQAGVQ